MGYDNRMTRKEAKEVQEALELHEAGETVPHHSEA